ncbi:tRNA (guanosine(46)-N7)-methyltransferase TrmB [Nitrincola sp. MINF-07-Sa-05]|uniref:tRNA (guanosine(46)-N7)-methyltransferase TrmB n=1 Tax=Nitrincola salilacus TaxID=3400273 RepID=UPI0039184924
MSEEIEQKSLRSVRSFVIRAGRMTEGQERAMQENWPVFGLELSAGMQDFSQVFGRDADIVLEIGFGMGASLAEMARLMPQKNFIGIEVHPPGVGRLLSHVRDEEIGNIRVYREDALEVLEKCVPDASLETVQLFFPDPWPKKRHNKRRIVQPAFADLIRRKLKLGGQFHMATDWGPYAEHMMEVMSAAEGYENQAGEGQYSPQPEWRPVTKFQKRGEDLGHGVWDLIFVRTA